jgi:4-aminobutyrate aminotransferase/(S)-3-amino-2-methylpropionate transaminase
MPAITLRAAWQAAFPLIGDVRRRGAMAAVELVRDRETLEPAKGETQRIVRSAGQRAVLLISGGTLAT